MDTRKNFIVYLHLGTSCLYYIEWLILNSRMDICYHFTTCDYYYDECDICIVFIACFVINDEIMMFNQSIFDARMSRLRATTTVKGRCMLTAN